MKNRKSGKCALALLLFGSLKGAAAPNPDGAVLNLNKAKSRIEFLSVGTPGAIKIRGKVSEEKSVMSGIIRIQANVLTAGASVLLDEFDTGIELRNRHMKEKYLETQKWPKAELALTKMTLPESCLKNECEASRIPFEGTLSLHGTTKTVSGLGEVKKKANEIEANFDFKFPLSDFGIETPSFMGISVTKDVTVTVGINGTLVSQ